MEYLKFIDYYRHKYALQRAKPHTCASRGNILRVLLINVFILMGCSVPIRYYLRNYSNKIAVVDLYLNNKEKNKSTNDKYYEFRYSKTILPIKYDLNNILNSINKSNLMNDSIVEITVPSNSTFFLGFGVNFIHESFYKMVVKQAHINDTILFEEENKFNIKKEGVSKYSASYDLH